VNVSCPECRSVFRVDPAKIPELGLRARCSVCGGVITIGAGSSIDEEFAPATRHVSAPAMPAPSVPTAAPVMTPASALRNTPLASAVAPSAPPAPPVVERVATRPVTPPVATRPVMPPTATPPARPVMFPPRPAKGTPPASSMPTSSPGGMRPPAFAPRPTMPPVPPARPTPAMPSAAARPTGPMRPSGAVSQPPIAPPAAARESMATPTRTPINPFLANEPNAKARRLSRALVSDLVTYFPQRRDEGLRDGTLKDLFREEIKKSYEEYVDQVGKDFADSTTHFQDALNDILAGGQRLF
jgi:predicted Zn finger-like uncharacterized protein